ncbi:nucleotidyl transferase AbiEii/AbiGii toxin family protein [Mycobacterium sp. M1]|uniref:Nucleotidyl transferase AbiEii/AbiGii toxin family protein n=1 Tax=Mycolicibacter acidiphilus TaxID=2835306 RepID=A0ABS5RQJ5_9MYCO|nr:nucleotidyl transferase AbiEii/AbiGii toxin family protein [Mycolicibacter acidiphilus]MBS9535234.1 nucleotidyl transferase AbiEii/AbiGii toxin family protein [Mycolicibacter acidiphilus]
MSPVSRDTPAGQAYLDLQAQAKASGRLTDELIQLYVLEGFLARLAVSPVRQRFVLKGGVLLAAFGNRRPTRDIDLAGLAVSNDVQTVLELVRSVLGVPLTADDGIEFDPGSARAEAIREEDEYAGVRVSVGARLARGRTRFHVDVNVGDPIWPEPTLVLVPRLRGGEPIAIAGYPLHMVYAEKIVTAAQRGTANTRWRDFADIWTLSHHHRVGGSDLQHGIGEVARHRHTALAPLREVLDGYADIAQARWAAWRRRTSSNHLPEAFDVLLDGVIEFADPAITGTANGHTWDPGIELWR